jgi:hypothetical protein
MTDWYKVFFRISRSGLRFGDRKNTFFSSLLTIVQSMDGWMDTHILRAITNSLEVQKDNYQLKSNDLTVRKPPEESIYKSIKSPKSTNTKYKWVVKTMLTCGVLTRPSREKDFASPLCASQNQITQNGLCHHVFIKTEGRRMLTGNIFVLCIFFFCLHTASDYI